MRSHIHQQHHDITDIDGYNLSGGNDDGVNDQEDENQEAGGGLTLTLGGLMLTPVLQHQM